MFIGAVAMGGVALWRACYALGELRRAKTKAKRIVALCEVVLMGGFGPRRAHGLGHGCLDLEKTRHPSVAKD